MDTITKIVIMLFVMIAFPLALKLLNKFSKLEPIDQSGPRGERRYVIRLPRIYLWFGLVFGLVVSFMIIYSAIYPDETFNGWLLLVLFSGFITGAYLIWSWASWRIEVDHEFILYSSSLLKKQNFLFEEFSSARLFSNGYLEVFIDSKVVLALDKSYAGYRYFYNDLIHARIPIIEQKTEQPGETVKKK